MRPVLAFLLASSLLSGAGCAERRPGADAHPVSAAPEASVGSAPASVVVPAPRASAPAAPSALPTVASAAPSASPADSERVAAGAEDTEAPLTGPDEKPLPQTEDHPRVDTPAFHARMERLAQAIIQDKPELAHSSFFPLLAYQQVKAVAKPERDYRFRLLKAFDRDVHEYHQSLAADAAGARLSGIDVPDSAARWMKPGQEGNRLGYFRVLRSRLRLKLADGKERSFELTSMISWRGEWYVVHLHGFE